MLSAERRCKVNWTDHLEIITSEGHTGDTGGGNLQFSEPPELSVIVPAYNMEHYIERCLDSLNRQRGIVLEIIVVNDGSTDRTEDVVRELMKKYRNLRLHTQNNMGLYCARINGVSIASGRYVTFVDADDYVVDHFYPLALLELQDADILEFGMRKVKDGHILYEFSPQKSIYGCEEAVRRQFEKGDAICSNCNKIYKRALFSKLSFDERIRCCEEDKLINVKTMCEARKIISVPNIGYIYDTRADSITTRGLSEGYLEILETGRKIYEFVRLRKPELSHMAGRDLCAHLSYCHLNLSSMGIEKGKVKRYRKQLEEEFDRIFRTENMGGYKPRKESRNRKFMLALFHRSPVSARLAYRALKLWNH